MMLGVIGTIIAMVVMTLGITYFNNHYVPEEMRIQPTECALMAAVLCSTDTIAVLTLIDERKFKMLYAILFGEGSTNDAVTILIYKAVVNVQQEMSDTDFDTHFTLTWGQVGEMSYQFI